MPILPPILLIIRAGPVFLPLPVFLLWPLLLMFVLIGPCLLLLVSVQGLNWRQRVLLPFRLLSLLAAMRGLLVDVAESDGTRVYVRCL